MFPERLEDYVAAEPPVRFLDAFVGMLCCRDNINNDRGFYSLWVQYPEACFGFAGVENEGWKVNISTSSTMCLC